MTAESFVVPPATEPVQHLLVVIHYVYPLTLFVFFLVSLTVWGIKTSDKKAFTPPPSIAPSKLGTPARPSSPLLGSHGSGGHGGHGLLFSVRRKRINTDDSDTTLADEKDRGKLKRWLCGEIERSEAPGMKGGLTPVRKAILNWLLVLVVGTFFANSANIILHALTKPDWWCGQDVVITTVSLLFVYAVLLLSQIDNASYPSVPHVLSWILGIGFEFIVTGINIYIWTRHLERSFQDLSSWKIATLVIDVTRVLILVGMTVLYAVVVIYANLPERSGETETSSLLDTANGRVNGTSSGYGSVNGPKPKKKDEEQQAGWARRNLIGARQSWWEYLHGYTVFFPYLWPATSRRLQFLMLICFLLMLAQRGVNVLVPNQLGNVVKLLGHDRPLPWVQIALYILYRFLQGNMGLLGSIRSTLWIPIGQYSYQALSNSAFEHVHSLSLDFHLGKKTGEVLSALSKGSSINNFLEQVTFQVIPMLIDLAVAVGYFLIKFDAYYALIVAIVTFCYLYITVRMAQWRADIRREMVNKSREEDAVKNDSMIAYETVKYFNAEGYEFQRYRNAVNAYQSAEYHVLFSLNIMNVSQNLMFMIGLLIACFLSAWQVHTGEADVSQFVALLTYLAQLQGPLNFFGTFYRSIQSSMINSERMLELFREKPTVVDGPHVEKLGDFKGEIKFEDVHFSYDGRKPALRGLDFTAAPGTTTAFVGESGGGKTTVLRLLFRFYNPEHGRIKFDGHDVRDLTIDSVREKISVVPQDTVLFNETLMYNLKYANPAATDEMVYEACRAASIHDKILAFPDQYNTKVGERGLRLSGGEKQRVAIARAILKNPSVILLDEATAALDSETEQHIQAALKELTRGRTTLVIAHRLSTITSADQILCIHQGQVAEQGTHEELLALKGRYYAMWNKQARAQKAQERLAKVVAQDDGSDTPDLTDTPPTPSVRRGGLSKKRAKKNISVVSFSDLRRTRGEESDSPPSSPASDRPEGDHSGAKDESGDEGASRAKKGVEKGADKS